MSLEELQFELLRAEFPFLRPDHDPDVERYFELRSAGRPYDALALYQNRLKPRYPDEDFRARVLGAYRRRDPAYRILINQAYEALGRSLIERTKRSVKYLALRVSSYDASDAYSTIKAAESILAMLPREKFEAMATIERLRRFAERSAYYVKETALAEELIRAYLNETLEVVENERERRSADRKRAADERRRRLIEKDREDIGRTGEEDRKKAAAKRAEAERARVARPTRVAAALDLSKIRFSATDLARIRIPPTLTRQEDKTLAFCFKYWNLTADPAFERVLFLYSRKFASKHYDVYTAIARGRRAGQRDEEILAAVSSILTVGYYYSIRGDAYLLRSWAALKNKLEKSADIGLPGAKVAGAVAAGTAEGAGAVQSVRSVPRRRSVKPTPTPAPTATSAKAVAAIEAAPPAGRTEAGPAAIRPAVVRPAAAKPTAARPLVARTADKKPSGSVADRLRRLSGRSYDVYQERFLAKARPAIRKILSAGHGGKFALFVSIPQEAEDLLFAFMRDHYADPFMDWEGSEQRSRLSELGFDLASIDPVIEDCYKRL